MIMNVILKNTKVRYFAKKFPAFIGTSDGLVAIHVSSSEIRFASENNHLNRCESLRFRPRPSLNSNQLTALQRNIFATTASIRQQVLIL